MRLLALPLLFAFALPAAAQDLVAKTDALSPADELKKFKLPEGFTAQLVASEPDIQKPMQLAFDARNRLWVTTSHHYPWAAEAGKGTDKLFVLSDFDASGKAKTVRVFDDTLNIPIGVLPLPDCKSVIVSECGKILKLTDTDDDMKADKREVLFEGFGFKDTHGMTNSFTLLPDGWVYACHGFANDSKVKGKDGHEVTMNSGHTFRFKPDGSRIEVFTRGQVNPFGIAVDPWLNLYTADCHSKPVTQLIRGAYYDSFGKPHDGLGYGPHVYQHLHNSTGLCGVVYYAADQFPKEWNGVMFLGNVVTSRINVDRVGWKGSTPVGKELADFLVSDDPWFRPVDVKLGPDGALYVSDFYNKIIGHYEVDLKHPGRDKDRGRVWRIVYTGKDGKAPKPEFARKDWTEAKGRELIDDFSHPNTSVRLLAANEAAGRASFRSGASDPTTPAGDRATQAGMLSLVGERWNGERSQDLSELIEHLKKNPGTLPPEPTIVHVVQGITSRKEWGENERGWALGCFNSFDNARVKRAVIDGMTAHPHADFIDPLLAFAKTIPADDTHMKHAAKVALRNCLDAGQAQVNVAKDAKSADVRPLVDSLLGCTHPNAVGVLADLLTAGLVGEEQAFEAGRKFGRYGEAGKWVEMARADRNARDSKTDLKVLAGTFRGIQESGFRYAGEALEKMPNHKPTGYRILAGHALSLARAQLENPNSALVPQAVEVCREVRQTFVQDKLPGVAATLPVAVVTNSKFSADHKVAVAELMVLFGSVDGRRTVRELASDPTAELALRQRLIPLLLATSPTTGDCSLGVAEIKTAPYTQAVNYATGLAGDKFGADLLLASIGKGEAPARLLQEKAVVDRLKATGVKDLDAKLKELTKNIPPAEKRVEDLLKARTAGFPKAKTDVAKGKAVFTKNCAVCHQLNSEGAKVGPQLDGVGIRGVARLLEDTLDPNRNVDHTFRATKLDLKDGKSLTGLVREDGAVSVLVDNAGKEHRIPTADVDKKTQSHLSAMPANLDTVMTEDEYYHLLAFLLEQKPKK
jgi:putative heme-binding domain-containing protein